MKLLSAMSKFLGLPHYKNYDKPKEKTYCRKCLKLTLHNHGFCSAKCCKEFVTPIVLRQPPKHILKKIRKIELRKRIEEKKLKAELKKKNRKGGPIQDDKNNRLDR